MSCDALIVGINRYQHLPQLRALARDAEMTLFYFSGHGIPDKEGCDRVYLAAIDTNPTYPHTDIYPELNGIISNPSQAQERAGKSHARNTASRD